MNNFNEGETISPNVANFIISLRDIGYSFEIAIADIIDNCISADARNIKILAKETPSKTVAILDDGNGMTEEELVEAMRLATKSPQAIRAHNDLGRFGLGLKTASFSQCKKLTVISKSNSITNIRQWDLDYISKQNKWTLLKPNLNEYNTSILFKELESLKSGTIVIWGEIDRITNIYFPELISKLRLHLSLVFHRFMEFNGSKKINIFINNNQLAPFNPFNPNSLATQQINEEIIKVQNEDIIIQPYILPHHSKISQQEFEKYATEDGYTRSQGFYLYRANRLLIYGTWWGLHKTSDAYKLVRIKIDIPNNQDELWGIDVKKSRAEPVQTIRNDLKRIISQVNERGVMPFTGRGRTINDISKTKKFWALKVNNGIFTFVLNRENPILEQIENSINSELLKLLRLYLNGVEAYIPLDSIQAQLNQNPHAIDQKEIIRSIANEEIINIFQKLNFNEENVKNILNTEMFKEKNINLE